VPAIGLTAYQSGEHELLAAGALLVLRKPWNELTLLDAVERLLSSASPAPAPVSPLAPPVA
jgi:CheY-like chemotaxis protein